MNPQITSVCAREVLDSRGNPTVEVEIMLSDKSIGRGIVPSGASKGEHEALELRDGDPNRYFGKGTLKAVKNVEENIARCLQGKAFSNIQELDRQLLELDASRQKSKLGANAILGVSVAFAHALSQHMKKPLFLVLNDMMGDAAHKMALPIPLMNIVNGGQHANNGLEFQEFMIVPHGFDSFREALRAGAEVFQNLKNMLAEKKLSTAVGDEGGFAPGLESNENALELILDAIQSARYLPGKQISIALDVAASSLYSKTSRNYALRHHGKKSASCETLLAFYGELIKKYPIVSIEDGLDENDWEGWTSMTRQFGKGLQLVGDDIFVTDKARLQKGISGGVANAILIKINQIGSFTETFDTMGLAKENRYRSVVSHRSGETEDVTIAHLAVASGCGQIKTGSLSRSERTAKYNELLRIEEWGHKNNLALQYSKVF